MEYRNLGRTGVKVSALCLGCMMFGGKTNQEDSIPIIERAIDQGINFLDIANVYSRGRSEEVVGEALKLSGKRGRIVLATKVFGTMDDDDPNAWHSHRRHIIEQCEASLNRLQTDYIDLYQIHRPTSEIPIDETLRALDDLVRSGKVRYIGTSTFAAWQLVESLWASKEFGLNRFVSEQPPYHLLDRRIERELIPMAQTYGLAILPWSPLAGGFLTGKYARGESRPTGTRFYSEKSNDWADNHFTDSAFDALELVQQITQEKGCTISQFALAWCAQQPGITSPIIGPRTMEQLEDNLIAADIMVTDEDRATIDKAIPSGRAIVPYYQADFGPHKFRW
jgi:aryl-alcohol dehydrogenase-like predicted oxidoreductase